MHGDLPRPHRNDRELEIIRKRGFAHEARYLAELAAGDATIVTIERDDDEEHAARIRRQADETIAAMAAGAEVIYQATFFDGRWLGYADFLLRVDDAERPSRWGPYHYEVADTKLARHVKAGAVLQICSYVDQLERIQGVRPREMKVVLGGSARETAVLRTDDYMAYYRAAKERFEAAVLAPQGGLLPTSPSTTYPEPVEHCDVCRWAAVCAQRRRDDDHLSLVAGITGRQRTALATREIDTVVRLANAPLPFQPPLDGTSAASIERVREQARVQVAGRGLPRPIHELILPARGSRSSRNGVWPCSRRRTMATSSWTWRATPTRSTMAWTTSSASSTRPVRSRRSGRSTPITRARSAWRARRWHSRPSSISSSPTSIAIPGCTSTTTPATSPRR